jgi:hypothetical protein
MDKIFFLLTGINTLIIIVVLFILFKMEINKLKMYIRKIDRKLENKNKSTYNNFNNNINNNDNFANNDNIVINDNDENDNNKINMMSDIDSYIDPLK